MAATQQSLDEERNNFTSSFDEDFSRPEPTEDETFGLNVEAAAAADGGTPAESTGAETDPPHDGDAAVVVVADGEALEEAAGEASAEASAAAASESASQENADADAGDEPTDPKEIQRKKSWEGRLRAEEKRLKELAAELEAKKGGAAAAPGTPTEPEVPDADDSSAAPSADAQATADALEQVAATTEDAGTAQRADELAEAVEDGSMSPEQAMKILSEDFGEDFVKMIRAIAGAEGRTAATKEVGALRGDVEGVISTIADSKTREHFEAIAEAHPDFNDVGQSEAFKAWAAEDPARSQIANGGSARQIIRMLNEFKAAAPAAPAPADDPAPPAADADADAGEAAQATSLLPDNEDVTDDELDAAEGVRSSNAGMQLPKEPGSGSYEEAWESF